MEQWSNGRRRCHPEARRRRGTSRSQRSPPKNRFALHEVVRLNTAAFDLCDLRAIEGPPPSARLGMTTALPSLHHSTTPSLHHSTTPSLHYSITPSLHYSITPLLHYSITPLLHHSITPSLHHSITPSLHYSITPLLHHSITPSLHHSITPLLHCSIPLPYGAVRNFCRMRSSGYCGKTTSAMKTLFGVRSRVAIVSG